MQPWHGLASLPLTIPRPLRNESQYLRLYCDGHGARNLREKMCWSSRIPILLTHLHHHVTRLHRNPEACRLSDNFRIAPLNNGAFLPSHSSLQSACPRAPFACLPRFARNAAACPRRLVLISVAIMLEDPLYQWFSAPTAFKGRRSERLANGAVSIPRIFSQKSATAKRR